MSETTATETIEDTTTETDAKSDEVAETVDWEDKFKGQQKVNRDLEAKLRKASEAAQRASEEADMKNKSAEEQAVELARREAREEATKAANARLLKSELKAAAKGKLADPTDAALYINLDDFVVSDDGDVDAAALDEAIDDLLSRKPHLAASKANRFDGSADQGAAGKETNNGPKQLTREDLIGMSPAQIVAADEAGQLRKLYGFTK